MSPVLDAFNEAPPGKTYAIYQKIGGKLVSVGTAEPDPAKLPPGQESKLVDSPGPRFLWNAATRVFNDQAPAVNPAAALVNKANWNVQDSYDALKLILRALYQI